VDSRQSGDGNARRAPKPPAQRPARVVEAVRTKIGLQQRELHQIELGAAADAFEFAGNRFVRPSALAVFRFDHQLECGRLLASRAPSRPICRSDLSGVGADEARDRSEALSKADPAAGRDKSTPLVDRRNRMAGRPSATSCSRRLVKNGLAWTTSAPTRRNERDAEESSVWNSLRQNPPTVQRWH
jgi:hypothetical protein